MDAFGEPAPSMAAAASVGADRIELYTGPYADAFPDPEDRARSLARYANTARAAREAGLGVNAGHDLTLENLPPLHEALGQLDEVSIGHAFTADALWMGFDAAVRAYLDALTSHHSRSR
jgi:pyridoxine 5-phosphate synthase